MSRRPRPRPTSDAHDERALVTELYRRHAPAIASYALRRAGPADAADVVADTFLVAWRRRGDLPEEPATLPWLYGVARRVLANQRRTRARRTRLHERLRQQFVDIDTAPPPSSRAESFRVAVVLGQLSDTDAELLRLSCWEELSPAEIAVVLDLDPAAARQRLRRARERFRAHLSTLEVADVDASPGADGHDERAMAAQWVGEGA